MNTFTCKSVLTVSALALLFLNGCTRLTVAKVSPGDEATKKTGIKYSLPKPYIQVTPQEDGSILADVVYMPDPDNTYVIEGRSYFAAHNLTVSTEDGLLKKVAWTGDSAAVVGQGLTSAAAVAEKSIAADMAALKAAETKSETAQKAVDDARLAVETARSRLALLIANNADPEAILEAKLALNEAQIKLSHAMASLDRVKTVNRNNADAPQMQIAGPILYAINERVTTDGKPTVQLVAVSQVEGAQTNKQPRYPADPPYKEKKPESTLEFFPKGVQGIRADRNGNLQHLVIATSALAETVEAQSTLELNGAPVNVPPISLQTPTTVRIALNGLGAGDYTLKLAYKTAPNVAVRFTNIKFRILP